MQGEFHGFGQAGADFGAGDEPVDDHLDVVPHLPIQAQIVAEADHAAVYPGADKTLFLQILEQVAVFAFLSANQGASTRNFVPPGRAPMRSRICSRVWAVMGRWH